MLDFVDSVHLVRNCVAEAAKPVAEPVHLENISAAVVVVALVRLENIFAGFAVVAAALVHLANIFVGLVAADLAVVVAAPVHPANIFFGFVAVVAEIVNFAKSFAVAALREFSVVDS